MAGQHIIHLHPWPMHVEPGLIFLTNSGWTPGEVLRSVDDWLYFLWPSIFTANIAQMQIPVRKPDHRMVSSTPIS